MVSLAEELSKRDNVELHIITRAAAIPYTQQFIKNNIIFHVVKYSLFNTFYGFPNFLPVHVLSMYWGFKKNVINILNRIKPDIIHAYGTEGPYAYIALKTEYPALVSMQGVINKIYKLAPSIYFFFSALYRKNFS